MAYYEQIKINGVHHHIAAIAYDYSGNNRIAKVMMMSFWTKQQHDQCIASINKGTTFYYCGRKIKTKAKGYISNMKKCNDDNLGDGYHAIIYADDDETVIINDKANYKDIIFDRLKQYKCGLIDEWKDYFINFLIANDYIKECTYDDNTGNKILPTVYILNDITTELLANVKSSALKNNTISLPVSQNVPLDSSMEIIDIIENHIIPNISSEKCHYNVGEDISPIIKSKIRKGKRMVNLFKRQQIIAQGIFNYIKDGNDTCIFNGGTGIGKTYTTIKLSHAVIEDILKKKDAYIGVYSPRHIIKNWRREFINAFQPLGITPKITIIRNYADITKLNKKPNGIEVLIFPKDIAKRSYMKAHNINVKYHDTDYVDKFVKTIGVNQSGPIEVKKCYTLPKKQTKLAICRYTKMNNKLCLLYREVKTSNGKKLYLCTTNSKTLLKIYGDKHKFYNFIISDLKDLKDTILNNSVDILNENKNNIKTVYKNYITCPCCGGKVYESEKYLFSDTTRHKYLKNPFVRDSSNKLVKRRKSYKLSKCNNYVKADGSTISDEELNIILARDNYNIVKKHSKVVYTDLNGNPLSGNDLQLAKRGMGLYKINIRKCNYDMFGYEQSPGGRVVNTGRYLRKIFGDKFLDICIFDECHLYANNTDQGYTMGQLCLASKINLLLSGTITGGKSSDLYYTFWRTIPQKMIQLGFEYKDKGSFIDMYGRRKRVTEEKIDYRSSNSGQTRLSVGSWTEIPGISPLLYNNFLASMMVSRKIEDMGIPLPPIKYIKEEVVMNSEQTSGYEKLKNDFMTFMRINKNMNIGGIYVKRLKSYLDWPQQGDIYASVVTDDDKLRKRIFVAKPTFIDLTKTILPKEEKLIVTIGKEIKQKRKVIVYTEFTGIGVSERLIKLLDKYFNVRALTTKTCKIEDREYLVEQWAKEGVEVIVCNPKIVETGLNLMSFPTMYFYDQTYDIKTLRQAEMRAYRPLQKKECRIYYAYYKNTIQEDAIKLIGTKKRASLAIEGLFGNDLLSDMGDGGDSIESILNKVLDGKIILKESDLDAFQFEEVDYEIIEEENNEEDDSPVEEDDSSVSTINKIARDNKKTTSTNNGGLFVFDPNFLNNLRKESKEIKKETNKKDDFFAQLDKLRNKGTKEVAATSESETEQVVFDI